MKRLTVYNHFGLGDTFESREFIMDWMHTLKLDTCEVETNFPAVFEDLPQIITKPLPAHRDPHQHLSKRAGHVIVNSWIGALNGETTPKGDFVISPGVGCTVDNLHRMHSLYMKWLGLRGMKKPVVEYLSDIDYSKVNCGRVDEFVNENKGKKLVLICNGRTGSMHAENFSMATMINTMGVENNVVYLLTERDYVVTPKLTPDVFFTDDITERRPSGSDFNAISYLSTFCDVIVGRCSGAQMPCETKRNWMDPSKTLLSFTHHDNGASFVRDPAALGLKMRRVHSDAATPEAAAEVLQKVLYP
jgi:hypothetical protein